MAQDDIQGQVVDGSGNPVSGAIVELTKSYQSSPQDEQVVRRVTTDSNGNYIFDYHPDGDGTTQEWHVAAYSHDGTAYVNSFNNPGVTADLPEVAIPDSAVLQYQIDEGSGTTLTDAIGSNDGSLTGGTWTSDTDMRGDYRINLDGTDDYIESSSNPTAMARDTDFSVALTVVKESSVSSGSITNWSDGTNQFNVHFGSSFINTTWYDESTTTVLDEESFSTPSTPFTLRLCVVWDSSNEVLTLYQNATEETGSDNAGIGTRTEGWFIGQGGRDENYGEFGIDNPIVYEASLSSSEVQQDYDAQPWS